MIGRPLRRGTSPPPAMTGPSRPGSADGVDEIAPQGPLIASHGKDAAVRSALGLEAGNFVLMFESEADVI